MATNTGDPSGWAWETALRTISMTADPTKLGNLASSWRSLADQLTEVVEALVGREVGHDAVEGTKRDGGLTEKLSDWTGEAAEAYQFQVTSLASDVVMLQSQASRVSSALNAAASGLNENMPRIPIPLKAGGYRFQELLNGTPSENSAALPLTIDGLRSSLTEDYYSSPSTYQDGQMLSKAKVILRLDVDDEGQFQSQDDSGIDLDEWYQQGTAAASSAAVDVVSAVDQVQIYISLDPLSSGPTAAVDETALDDGTGGDGSTYDGYSGGSGAGDYSTLSAGTSGTGYSATTAASGLSDGYTSAYDTSDYDSGYDSTYASASDSDYDSGLASVDSSGLSAVSASGGTGSLGTGSVGTGSLGTGSVNATTGTNASTESGTSPLHTSTTALGTGAAATSASSGSSRMASGIMGGAGGAGAAGMAGNQRNDGSLPLVEDDDPWGLDDDLPTGLIG